ncbi:hypothetical protein FRB91_004399 [Serendipita sp. 411]|nr:hypothetical protein FRB91_004399 [Serendipita sp. 411]
MSKMVLRCEFDWSCEFDLQLLGRKVSQLEEVIHRRIRPEVAVLTIPEITSKCFIRIFPEIETTSSGVVPPTGELCHGNTEELSFGRSCEVVREEDAKIGHTTSGIAFFCFRIIGCLPGFVRTIIEPTRES